MPSIKFQIPHPNEEGCIITGVIEQKAERRPISEGGSGGHPIALIFHGAMGHKDYLFLKKLAQNLPIDSCRFDFRGNHETNGTWFMGEKGFVNDLQDIDAVIAYLKTTYGYQVDLAVGHSRGSIVGIRWLCTSPEAQGVSGYVNVAGRYRMKLHNYYDRWRKGFEEIGFFDWKARVAGKEFVRRVTPEHIKDFEEADTSLVWTRFPPTTDVLTIHGLADKVVPAFDATIYARAFSNRPAATHTLHLIEKADHNFIGHFEEVVETIVGWWERKAQGTLTRDGVWLAGVKPKL